jgi:Uma2 family endonuclease
MATAVEPLTTTEYLARTWDERHTELIDGYIVVNEPTLAHQKVVLAVAMALERWVAKDGHGTASLSLDVPLQTRVSLAPDVLWFERPIPISSVRAPRMPDLVVEVRSPSTGGTDTGRKRDLYEHHGAQELWLADPQTRTVRTLRRSRPDASGFDVERMLTVDDTLTSPLLPGFAALVGELFVALDA